MGRDHTGERMIHHFSHEHPLQLAPFTHSQHPSLNTDCCGPFSSSSSATTNQSASDALYFCKFCGFFLHKTCVSLPSFITHPAHSRHGLSLLPNATFSCDGCSQTSTNIFSYHCQTCSYDLHPDCASLPLTTPNAAHPDHLLTLLFACPYAEGFFYCRVCLQAGGHAWLYRCEHCGFDAHLDCARAHPARPPVIRQVEPYPVCTPSGRPVQPRTMQSPNRYVRPPQPSSSRMVASFMGGLSRHLVAHAQSQNGFMQSPFSDHGGLGDGGQDVNFMHGGDVFDMGGGQDQLFAGGTGGMLDVGGGGGFDLGGFDLGGLGLLF